MTHIKTSVKWYSFNKRFQKIPFFDLFLTDRGGYRGVWKHDRTPLCLCHIYKLFGQGLPEALAFTGLWSPKGEYCHYSFSPRFPSCWIQPGGRERGKADGSSSSIYPWCLEQDKSRTKAGVSMWALISLWTQISLLTRSSGRTPSWTDSELRVHCACVKQPKWWGVAPPCPIPGSATGDPSTFRRYLLLFTQ